MARRAHSLRKNPDAASLFVSVGGHQSRSSASHPPDRGSHAMGSCDGCPLPIASPAAEERAGVVLREHGPSLVPARSDIGRARAVTWAEFLIPLRTDSAVICKAEQAITCGNVGSVLALTGEAGRPASSRPDRGRTP